MFHFCGRVILAAALLSVCIFRSTARGDDDRAMRIAWKDNYLTISGQELPGREMKILYIEAYCRPGATDRKWDQTTIGHKTRLVSAAEDGHSLILECTLADGVEVKHQISATTDEVELRH